MKKLIAIAIIICSTVFVNAQIDTAAYVQKVEKKRESINKEFKKEDTSPLDDKQRKKLESLSFFPIDVKYRVEGKLELTPNSKEFEMATSTGGKRKFVTYGVFHFEIDSEAYKIHVYQNVNQMESEDEELRNYLFIPFTDETNGSDTYGGGRFIETSTDIFNADNPVLDFNLCFNPYCVYSERYSCPIPPKENHLKLLLKAGERDFKYAEF